MTNRELRAVSATRAVAVVVAGLFAAGVAAQEQGSAQPTPTELLVKWLDGRRAEDQFEAFAKYRTALLVKHKRSWIAGLDQAMREFGSKDAAAPPAGAVSDMLADLRQVRAAAVPLHPYAPWLLLTVGANGKDLRLCWLVFEAMAEPGPTLDAECATESLAVVLGALGDDVKGASEMRRGELLEWLPELEGFADAATRLAFFRQTVEGFVEHLKAGEGIEPGALRQARVAQLDAQFLAEVKAAKGDPFAVVELMLKLAPGDVTNDLIYLLLAGSEGRDGDRDLEKAARKRFDEAWKAREKSGLDVEAMKLRLVAVGVKQVCADVGLGFEPETLRKTQVELGLWPSIAALDGCLKELEGSLSRLQNGVASERSSVENFKASEALNRGKQNEKAAEAARERREAVKRDLLQKANDYKAAADSAERNKKSFQKRLDEAERKVEEATKRIEQLRSRRARLGD